LVPKEERLSNGVLGGGGGGSNELNGRWRQPGMGIEGDLKAVPMKKEEEMNGKKKFAGD
jgi:hypothetical protein